MFGKGTSIQNNGGKIDNLNLNACVNHCNINTFTALKRILHSLCYG